MSVLLERVDKLKPEQRTLLFERLRRRLAEQVTPSLPRRPEGQAAPLSELQAGLWFLEQLEPGSPRFCLPGTMRVTGALDAELVEQALNVVVARHETLRTVFAQRDLDGAPAAHVLPSLHVPITRVDLGRLPEAEREAAAERLALEDALAPFDLALGPLLRVGLVRLSATEHVLLLSLHHIVADGWSLELLVRELSGAYAALAAGTPPSLPKLDIQYGDFAWWQCHGRAAQLQEQQLDYWRTQLAGAPASIELPTDRPRPARQSYWSGHARVELPVAVSAELRELGRRDGATLFMTLLAGFQALLYRLSGQEDVVVGSPIAGRRWSAVEPLIGFFVNMLPLRARFDGEPSFRELLRRVRASVLGAYAHQDVPFPRIVASLQVPRRLDRAPLFQTVFILLDHPPGLLPDTATPAGLSFGPLEIDKQTVKYDVILFAQPTGSGLAFELLYSTALYDAATAAQMLALYAALLEQASRAPEDSILSLRLLAAAGEASAAGALDDGAAEFSF
jgi:hypothetical protein